MYNSLFINENLDKGSHSEDSLKGIVECTNLIEAINYSTLYKSLGKGEFEKYIKNLITVNNVDLIFFGIGSGMIIDIFFIKELTENFDVKIIIGFPDSEHLFEDVDRYYAQAADIVWIYNPSLEKIFNMYGISTFCSQGFDTNRYKKTIIKKSIDVSFIGGVNRGKRKEYIDFLTLNGINVELAGFGTERGVISTTEKNMIVCQSRINLNFTGVLNNDRNIYNRIKQPKGRPQEVSLLGSFVLSEYASGLESMFNIGSEIDLFDSKEELLSKIKFYLANGDLRESMASKANMKAISLYETSYVVKKLLSALEGEKKTNKTYYLDPEFSSMFTSARFYYLVQSFLHGNFKGMNQEMQSILRYRSVRLKNFYYDIPRAFYHFFKDLLRYTKKVGFE